MTLQTMISNLEQSLVYVEIKHGSVDKFGYITSLESCTIPSNSSLECNFVASLYSSTYFDMSDDVKVDAFGDFEWHTLDIGSKLVCQIDYTSGGLQKHG